MCMYISDTRGTHLSHPMAPPVGVRPGRGLAGVAWAQRRMQVGLVTYKGTLRVRTH